MTPNLNPKTVLSKGVKQDTRHPQVFVPITTALSGMNERVRDALVSLSIAEIRPTLSLAQVVDTVNELQAAVQSSIEAHQLFVTEHAEAERDKGESLEQIQKLHLSRKGALATAYKEKTLVLMEEIRRSRTLHPPSLCATTLGVSVSISLKRNGIVHNTQEQPITKLDESVIKQRFKQRSQLVKLAKGESTKTTMNKKK